MLLKKKNSLIALSAEEITEEKYTLRKLIKLIF